VFADSDAVLLHLGDDLKQVRVEALDPDTGHWMAVASGYRDKEEAGWLKIALPDDYSGADLRVLGSESASPFAAHLQPKASPEELVVDYPPSAGSPWLAYREDVDAAGGEKNAVIEEADIWAWNDSTLHFYNQYRGLQVIDMADPLEPQWVDYFRYPAKGEDLYTLEDGTVILIGTGNYWSDNKVALKFLSFDGAAISLEDTIELESGYYMDSRRYNDYLYVMTREWVEDLDPDGGYRNTPLIRLYTVSLLPGVEERVVDVKSFQGNGWLDAVLTAQQDGILLCINKWYNNDANRHYRWRSEVHVLVPGDDGIPELAGIAPLSGILHDKFKLNYNDGLLTAVSQKADWSTGQFSRATKLENFSLGENGFRKTGSLDLAPGETLFATRFYDDTVYVVTFLFVDPLFAIDNSNPAAPRIVGELEVPGWSNYIEWVDDQLFAVGIEDSKLTVSIFDVADPENMSLKDRVFLNEDSWAYSEAQYDDQAISFFPEQQLLMLPFTTWSWTSTEQIQAMQLISWDEDGLQLRGAIQHIDTPRRGTLTGDTVVTISGREVVTTDITNPDLPIEGGKTTLAWNVQTLISHHEYLLQLETSSSDFYGRWFWEYPYGSGALADPVLYVTSIKEPNIPAAEIRLEPGRLLNATHVNGYLVLLQDISEYEANYWEIPEQQSLAARVYSLENPLEADLVDEVLLEDVEYLGDSFEVHSLPDGSILWASGSSNNYGYYYLDFWPGPWFYQRTLSYLVSSLSNDGEIDIPVWKSFSFENSWNNSSKWFWEDPLLVASVTDYLEHPTPKGYPEYEARTKLVGIDFSVPESPVELPTAVVPSNLVAMEPLQDGINHYLYFEPYWNQLEVWGWDETTTFKLFHQKIHPDDWTENSTYSMAWMPPFHVRNRSRYEDGTSSVFLEVWLHDFLANKFKNIKEYAFEDKWLSNNAVMEPFFLQSTNDALHFFKADAGNASFDLLESINFEFPNVYGLQLDQAVMTSQATLLPAGLYGVEVIPFVLPTTGVVVEAAYQLEIENGWSLLDNSQWHRADKNLSDEAGILREFSWLYYPDSMRELDPSAEDAGDFWRESSWFGWYAHDAISARWIHHLEHGSLYTYPGEVVELDGAYILDAILGIFWTRADTYPWLYSFDREEWLYYLKGSGENGKRWFYGLDSGWF